MRREPVSTAHRWSRLPVSRIRRPALHSRGGSARGALGDAHSRALSPPWIAISTASSWSSYPRKWRGGPESSRSAAPCGALMPSIWPVHSKWSSSRARRRASPASTIACARRPPPRACPSDRRRAWRLPVSPGHDPADCLRPRPVGDADTPGYRRRRHAEPGKEDGPGCDRLIGEGNPRPDQRYLELLRRRAIPAPRSWPRDISVSVRPRSITTATPVRAIGTTDTATPTRPTTTPRPATTDEWPGRRPPGALAQDTRGERRVSTRYCAAPMSEPRTYSAACPSFAVVSMPVADTRLATNDRAPADRGRTRAGVAPLQDGSASSESGSQLPAWRLTCRYVVARRQRRRSRFSLTL